MSLSPEPFRLRAALASLVMTGTLGTLPLYAFARLVRAEGPLNILLAWSLISALLLHGALRLPPANRAAGALRAAAAAVILSGLSVILLQVNVAQRSLAEAWLELARKGDPFGFFSFFAAEIYAALSLAPSALLSARKPAAAAAALGAVNALCAGIILGSPPFLALAVLLSLALALALGSGSLRYRLLTASVPFLGAAALSLFWALYTDTEGNRLDLPRPPDLTSLIASLAPDFPLLVDVPGYGLSVGSGTLPSRVFLSSRALFSAAGEPGSTHYLADSRYARWNGEAWESETLQDSPLPLAGSPQPGRGGLTLTLREDFYPSIPVEWNTAGVWLHGGIPDKARATRERGVLFAPSARRGTQATLYSGGPEAKAPENPGGGLNPLWLDTSFSTERMRALAGELLERARQGIPAETGSPEGDEEGVRRRFAGELLRYFAEDFEYSLNAGNPPAGKDRNDWFIFESRKGFCSYFASACVMLAREGGIPARLAEGFRVTLGERGEALITGNNAHAWAELYLDGDWRTVEPTPPYASDDPFAWTRSDDGATLRQLQAVRGVPSREAAAVPQRNPSARELARLALPPAAALAGLAAAILFLRALFLGERGKAVRRARALVRRAKRAGISPPEITGWIAWKEAASGALGERRGREAEEAADEMIRWAYGKRADVRGKPRGSRFG